MKKAKAKSKNKTTIDIFKKIRKYIAFIRRCYGKKQRTRAL